MLKSLFKLLFAASIIWSCSHQPQADLIVFNGTIYTVDSAFSTAEAMVIKDGKIVTTGDFKSLSEKYNAIETLDLEGSIAYPGFNDAHCHYFGYARNLRTVNLIGTKSMNEVIERVVSFQNEFPSEFIVGRGWDQNDWDTKEFPTKDSLDLLFPNTPIYLGRIDGHAAIVNQATLDKFSINETTEATGGIVVKNENGLTGVLVDHACDLVKLPHLEKSKMITLLKEAEQNLFAAGLTSLTDAGLNPYAINLIDSLQKAGELSIRLNIMVSDSPENLDYYLSNSPIVNEQLTVKSFKFYLDGALGSRGALMLEPYADDTANFGLQMADKSHYLAAAKRLKEAGWQMCVHAIGDSANRLVLDVYEEALAGDYKARWRIEHAQIVHPTDIPRFGDLGVLPSIQPTHATSDMYWADERLGANRMVEAYPYQSLLQSASVLPLGTDFPVEDIDPLKTFYSAVFRQDTAGFPPGSFGANEKLSREETLRGMTTWAAYASFEEKIKGSLEEGLLADFVILDKDIMKISQDDFFDAQVLKTYVAGKLVFAAP